jgi:hypothetical protein
LRADAYLSYKKIIIDQILHTEEDSENFKPDKIGCKLKKNQIIRPNFVWNINCNFHRLSSVYSSWLGSAEFNILSIIIRYLNLYGVMHPKSFLSFSISIDCQRLTFKKKHMQIQIQISHVWDSSINMNIFCG